MKHNPTQNNVIYISPTSKQRIELNFKEEIKIKRIENEGIKKEPKPTYPQQWESYNKAQTKEKIILMNILDELLDYIDFPKTVKVGRNPIPLKDKIMLKIFRKIKEKKTDENTKNEKTPNFLDKIRNITKSIKLPEKKNNIAKENASDEELPTF